MNLPIFKRDPDCDRCERHTTIGPNGNVCVPTTHLGAPPSSLTNAIIFVGMNPGYHEDIKCEPFIGKSGQLLRKVYIPALECTDTTSVYLTNIVRCGPNPDVKDEHMRQCTPTYLLADLERIIGLHSLGKIALVLLGADAVKGVFKYILGARSVPKLKEAFDINGESHRLFDRDIHVFTTYHPAFILRANKYLPAAEDHMALVESFFKGTLPVSSKPTIVPMRSPRTCPSSK